ncbi:50S ribosomal protein L11 methyltransferase [Basilea psittacipulmonis]|uniref:Ribosomal protein L11 methyltransferase n=1 Tax=Basilea psittacipulmonis DSM 24701 TaxID=1072685 RepID=A0A077DBU2_9BURK|nr:50S ribosomal protein L11 methyltransferase [Basilea psittacipulmonis]AIL32300.1 ribosomal protein L11 methyltransferase [Basilea psittacipulmonis DSM 24701]
MRELVIECPLSEAEALSDRLLDSGALSVSIEDAQRDSEFEQAMFGEPGMEIETHAWEKNIVVSLWPDEVDENQVLEALELSASDVQWREVPDEDWVRLTQSQFDPIKIGEKIWIVPSWHSLDDVPSGSLTLQLDPGLAFGTGSHPTTRLCAKWLEAHLQSGMSVLDYGCGSGILGIIASKLGAKEVYGTDIDEQAITAATYNAQVNQTPMTLCLPDAMPADKTFDVVVANILSNPLKMLAPLLCHRVAKGGFLILSGILDSQEAEIKAFYAPWIVLQSFEVQEGWVCLYGQMI